MAHEERASFGRAVVRPFITSQFDPDRKWAPSIESRGLWAPERSSDRTPAQLMGGQAGWQVNNATAVQVLERAAKASATSPCVKSARRNRPPPPSVRCVVAAPVPAAVDRVPTEVPRHRANPFEIEKEGWQLNGDHGGSHEVHVIRTTASAGHGATRTPPSRRKTVTRLQVIEWGRMGVRK